MTMRICAAALLLPLLAAGCFGRDDSIKWTEDVRLPDGRVVTLTRYQEFKGPHELGRTPTASDYWFEFKHPDGGETVRWQSNRDLATLALMLDGKVPVLLVKPQFGSSMERFNCPNPPYMLYRYESGAWVMAPIAQVPVKRLRVNMTFSPKDSRQQIAASGYRLSAEDTSMSFHNHRRFVIDFTLMKEQTFALENCGRIREYLIDDK